MLEKSDLGRLLEYTVWANHRALRGAALLTIDQFRKDLKGSHGGVRGTLTHMMSAEAVWRTQTVWPLLMVPAAVVKVVPQPIE